MTAQLAIVSNSSPLERASANAAPPVAVAPSERPLPLPSSRVPMVALVAASLAGHAALVLALGGEPASLASVGEHTISVEIAVGTDAPAGLGATPSETEAEVQSAAVKETITEPAPQEERQERAAAEQQEEPHARTVAAAPADEPVVQAAVEALPEPEPSPPNPRREEAQKPAEQRTAARPQPEASGSNSIGRGRSASDPNYLGRIVAHLGRHKRYPAEARSKRQKGKAVISFALDGEGRVSWVKLVSSTGSIPLDREAQAMVQRASPFPRPPNGQPQTFTAPVSFSLTR